MQPLACCREARRLTRAGFTLLELLVAIVIIGVLAGLVLTVAGSASAKARNAQVQVDIQDLVKSIAAFKQRFGVEPPSRIVLYEFGAGAGPNVAPFSPANPADDWGDDDPEVRRSTGLIRRLWPQFDFALSRDINGDGVIGGPITLTGAECLVFFLGGMPSTEDANENQVLDPGEDQAHNDINGVLVPVNGVIDIIGVPLGFSTNPANPFTRLGSNRERFHEFEVNRFVDLDGDTMREICDPLPNQRMPYLYFSSYEGRGYDVANEITPSPPGGTFVDVYRQGPCPTPPCPTVAAWNANSYQIISPGSDQLYGVGGEYNPDTADTRLTAGRKLERDNIASFGRSGTLAP